MPNPVDSVRAGFLRRPGIRGVSFALLLLAVALGLRAPGLDKTIWNLDEGSTFTMAEIVRHGGVLYQDAADNRTPLVPYAKALILTVVGDWNFRGVHLVLAGMLGLTAIWIWLIGRAAGDPRTGVFGAVYFTLLSFVMLTVVDTMSAHTGWFLIFFSGLGMWAFLGAMRRSSPWLSGLAGVAFALAALAKQPGLFDWGVCFIICLLSIWHQPRAWRIQARLIAGLALGLALPLVMTFWYFKTEGAWDDFLRYAWDYNTQLYIPEVAPLERWKGIRIPFALLWAHAPYALVLGVLGGRWLLQETLPSLIHRDQKFPVLAWLILGWTASGLASTILSGRDFAHYSIQVLPGLSLACGWVTVRLWERAASWNRPIRHGLHLVLGLGLLSLAGTALHRSATFDTNESLSRDVGRFINSQTQPEDRIFVWGYEPELHVFSQRLPSTRFVYAVFLTGLIPWTNLDPLKDTTYAIVPGAWDDFWTDFNAHPPAMIVDTHANRGFLKYPLRRQTKLWALIQRDYVEVTHQDARSMGYSIYKRVVPPINPSAWSPSISDRVILKGDSLASPGTLRIQVQAPTKSTQVNLLLDGKPYRRVTCPPEAENVLEFFVLQADLPLGDHVLQAIVEGETVLASAPLSVKISQQLPAQTQVKGPPIKFGENLILPFAVENIQGTTEIGQDADGFWQTNAPTSLAYHRPPELALIEFSLAFNPGAYDGTQPQKTDGVDVVVQFTPEVGGVQTLYRRHLDPADNPNDRGLITARVMLPGMEPGILTLLITPGAMNIPAFDWTNLHDLKGEYSPLSLTYHDKLITPLYLDAKFGLSVLEYQSRQVVMAHAPSLFDLPQVAGLGEISGEFGFLASAWQGPKMSAGATFSIEQLRSDGSVNLLLKRTLRPAENPADREVQAFKLAVPSAAGARLRFSISPANPHDNAFNHTFWHALRGGDFAATINWGRDLITSTSSEAPNGFAIMEENGQDVLFAHAPSQLVFPIPANARHLSGKIGLILRAYTGDGNTDGANFVVEFEDGDGHHTLLLQRLLQPRSVPADQGAQDFTLTLPVSPGGKLILRTAPSPTGRLDYTWSYWQDLQFSP